MAGCVERYYPEEDDLITGTLVINAHLTNQSVYQEIEISRSVTLLFPSADPVSGAYAQLIREDGEIREFPEARPGFYGCELDETFLQTGSSYMLHVVTPDGSVYESEFDEIRPVPGIDSIYYEVETASYETEGDTTGGVRFYVDFTYNEKEYKFLRWEVTETYEFHNPDMEGFIWDTDRRVKPLPIPVITRYVISQKAYLKYTAWRWGILILAFMSKSLSLLCPTINRLRN